MTLLTNKEAAEKLGISRDQFFRLIDRHPIPVVKCGTTRKGWRYRPETIEALIDSLTVTSTIGRVESTGHRNVASGTREALTEILGPCRHRRE